MFIRKNAGLDVTSIFSYVSAKMEKQVMTITDWLMITAVFLGPIVAVRLTRYLDDRKEVRARKLEIFKTLMATRAYTSS